MSESRELVLIEKAEQMLAEARDIDTIKAIRDRAQAPEAYAKKVGHSKDVILHAAVIKVQAERGLCQVVVSVPVVDSAAGNQFTGMQTDRSQNAAGPIRLQDLRITKSDSSRAQQIPRLLARTFERYLTLSLESGQEPTNRGVLHRIKEGNVYQSVGTTPDLPTNFVTNLHDSISAGRRYGTNVADPPWAFVNGASRGAARNHDPCMTVEQIAAEPVAELAAEKSHLHLWCPSALLPLAFSIIEAWNYEYRTNVVWVKPGIGQGNYCRCSHEILLFAVRNNAPFRDHSQRSWIEAARGAHSAKPEKVRALIEKVSPPPYLELYGRTIPRSQWTVFGNEIIAPTDKKERKS